MISKRTAGVAGVALASGDMIANLLAQSPKGQVLQSKFKGLADVALTQAKLEGCSYADVRFTMSVGLQGANASFNAGGGTGGRGAGGDAPGGGGGGAGFGGGGGGRGAAGVAGGAAAGSVARGGRGGERHPHRCRSPVGRLRRARHSQRRLGLREQSDCDRRRIRRITRSPPKWPGRTRSREADVRLAELQPPSRTSSRR